MRIVGVGMQQTNTDRANALRAEEFCGVADARLIERAQFVAAEIQPAADFADELQGNNTVRLDPKVGISVTLRHRLPGDLEDVPKTCSDDQPERIDLALQQPVGGNGSALGKTPDSSCGR